MQCKQIGGVINSIKPISVKYIVSSLKHQFQVRIFMKLLLNMLIIRYTTINCEKCGRTKPRFNVSEGDESGPFQIVSLECHAMSSIGTWLKAAPT